LDRQIGRNTMRRVPGRAVPLKT